MPMIPEITIEIQNNDTRTSYEVIRMLAKDEQENILQHLLESIPMAKGYVQNIYEKGKNIQSCVNRITEYAGNLLMSIDYIEHMNLNDLQNNPEFKNDIQEVGDSLLQTVNWACKVDKELENLGKQLDIAASGVVIPATISTVTLNMLITHVNVWNSENPHNAIIMQPPDFNRGSIERDLDQRLNELDPSNTLVNGRKGAWQNFYSGFFLNLKSACNLMRDILTYLLDHIAENDLVKQADWWCFAKDTKDGVSKRQKIRYLIYEKSDADIDSDLTIIENNVDQCKKIHDELCAVAHNKPGYEDSVKNYLRAMEDILLHILEYRHRIQQLRKIQSNINLCSPFY